MSDITVIMASYLGHYEGAASNREAKFRRAVNSCLANNPLELVVVSDGCAVTNHIVNTEYKYDVTLISLPKQPLFSGNVRQAGLDAAYSDWVCYLDTDDYFGPEHLKNITNQLDYDYDWFYYDDYVNQVRRNVSVNCGSIGTSSIVHYRETKAKWGNGYGHDWFFVAQLGDKYKKIENASYQVCHLPGNLDV